MRWAKKDDEWVGRGKLGEYRITTSETIDGLPTSFSWSGPIMDVTGSNRLLGDCWSLEDAKRSAERYDGDIENRITARQLKSESGR